MSISMVNIVYINGQLLYQWLTMSISWLTMSISMVNNVYING